MLTLKEGQCVPSSSSHLVTHLPPSVLTSLLSLFPLSLLQAVSTNILRLGMLTPIRLSCGSFCTPFILSAFVVILLAPLTSLFLALPLQAFRTNAQNILSEGMLTPDKMERLTKLREQLGLTEEMANAVIRSITASKMVSGVDGAIASGKLTIKDVRGFRESGVDIDSMVREVFGYAGIWVPGYGGSGLGCAEALERICSEFGVWCWRVLFYGPEMNGVEFRGLVRDAQTLHRQHREASVSVQGIRSFWRCIRQGVCCCLLDIPKRRILK